MKITLPFYFLSDLNNNNIWNIVKFAFGKDSQNSKIVPDPLNYTNSLNDTLEIFYPKGSYTPSKKIVGGIGFYSSPKDIFPSDHVTLSYQVLFAENFDPVIGGKLPGLFIGKGTSKKDMKGGSGGKFDSSSCRIAWRANFSAEAYVYTPKRYQSEDYQSLPGYVHNPIYGDSLWRHLLNFQKNTWNNVSMRINLNTINLTDQTPDKNGELEITINNASMSYDKLVWRTSESYRITSMIFETFFGGSSLNAATPVDTWSYFKNLELTTHTQ